MPPPDLDDLPEPHDLRARLTTNRPLDWGDPLPTKAQIAASYPLVDLSVAEPTIESIIARLYTAATA